jgi:hypothetical protein
MYNQQKQMIINPGYKKNDLTAPVKPNTKVKRFLEIQKK